MQLAPAADLDDGQLDVVIIHDLPWRTVPHADADRLHRNPCQPGGRRGPARADDRDRRLAPVPGLRRWRPDRRPAGADLGLPGAMRVVVAAVEPWSAAARQPQPRRTLEPLDVKVEAARAAGRLARFAGRGGGTSLPGSCSCGWTRTRSPASRLDCHRGASRSPPPTERRRAPRWRPRSSSAPVCGSCITGPAPTWPPVSPRRWPPRPAAAGGSTASSGCSRSTSSGWTGLRRRSRPRSPCSATCSAISSTATASSRRSPIAGRRWSPASTGPRLALNADDPLIADLGRERAGVVFFGVEDRSLALAEMQHAADSKHCRRCGTAYEYDAVYFGHLGIYRCPGCGAGRPEPPS